MKLGSSLEFNDFASPVDVIIGEEQVGRPFTTLLYRWNLYLSQLRQKGCFSERNLNANKHFKLLNFKVTPF